MAIAHYGYLVLKMSSPAGVLTVQGDRTAAVAEARAEGSEPSASRAKAHAKAPRVRPSGTDEVPVKTMQVGVEPSQTTRIGGSLGDK
jgi:hypothetical protein